MCSSFAWRWGPPMREPAFWHRPRSLKSHLLQPLAALCGGNYHVGGAGKTPTVLALTKVLRELGETPIVLSRGYGGRLEGPVMVDRERHLAIDVGDEPLMLARDVP